MASYGALNFAMSDVYGGIGGTTETTIPDANDQKALVDDQKASANLEVKTKGTPIYFALIIIIAIAVIMGVMK